MQFTPFLRADGLPDAQSYERIVDAFQRGAIEAGRQTRLLHLAQATEIGAGALAARFPVLIAAGVYVTTDADLALLRDYVAAGGHLIVGPRTGYADEEARARVEVSPPRLADLAGSRYDEYSNLEQDVPVVSTSDELRLGAGAVARLWIDGLIADDAEVLARYVHPRFGDFPAVTSRAVDGGRVTVVGCVPGPTLASGLVSWASAAGHGHELAGDTAEPVTVASGALPGGRRAWFVFNWGWEPQALTLAVPVSDTVTGAVLQTGTEVSLTAWSSRTFLSQ
jgi:beta-galactosidase